VGEGCQLRAQVEDGVVVARESSANSRVNQGRLLRTRRRSGQERSGPHIVRPARPTGRLLASARTSAFYFCRRFLPNARV
jgi:hypothetical protein